MSAGAAAQLRACARRGLALQAQATRGAGSARLGDASGGFQASLRSTKSLHFKNFLRQHTVVGSAGRIWCV